MKITICGSIAFYNEMLDVKQKLEELGHEVKLPPHEVQDASGVMIPVKEFYARRKVAGLDETWIWDRKGEAIRWHFQKVEWSDAIIVLNYDKNGVSDYIGANTLLEIGLAFHLNKKIFLLHSIPEMSYKEEILGMKPVVLKGDLEQIE